MPRRNKNKNTSGIFSKDKQRLEKILHNWEARSSEIEKLKTSATNSQAKTSAVNFISTAFSAITSLSWPESGLESSGKIRQQFNKIDKFPADQLSKIEPEHYQKTVKLLEPEELLTAARDLALKTIKVFRSLYSEDKHKPEALLKAEKKHLPEESAQPLELYNKLIYFDFRKNLFDLKQVKLRLEEILRLWDDEEILTTEKQIELIHLINQEAGEKSHTIRTELSHLKRAKIIEPKTANKIYSLLDAIYKIRHRNKDSTLTMDGSNKNTIKDELKEIKQIFDATQSFWDKLEHALEPYEKRFKGENLTDNELSLHKKAIAALWDKIAANTAVASTYTTTSHKPEEVLYSIYLSIDFIKQGLKSSSGGNSADAGELQQSAASDKATPEHEIQLQKQALVILKNNLASLWQQAANNFAEDTKYQPTKQAPVSEIVKNASHLRNFIMHEDISINSNILNETLRDINKFSININFFASYAASFILPHLSEDESAKCLDILKTFNPITVRPIQKISNSRDKEVFITYIRIYSAAQLGIYEGMKAEFDENASKYWQLLNSPEVNIYLKAKLLDATKIMISNNLDPDSLDEFEKNLKAKAPQLLECNKLQSYKQDSTLKLQGDTQIYNEMKKLGVVEGLRNTNQAARKIFVLLGVSKEENPESIKTDAATFSFNREFYKLAHLLNNNKDTIVGLLRSNSPYSNLEEIRISQNFLNKFFELVHNIHNLLYNGYLSNFYESNMTFIIKEPKEACLNLLNFIHYVGASLSKSDWELLYQDKNQSWVKMRHISAACKFASELEKSPAVLPQGQEDRIVDLREKVIKNATQKFSERGWHTQSIKILLANIYHKYILSLSTDKHGSRKSLEDKDYKAIEDCLDKALDSLAKIDDKAIIVGGGKALNCVMLTLLKKCRFISNKNVDEGKTFPIDFSSCQYLKMIAVLDHLYPGNFDKFKSAYEELLNIVRENQEHFPHYKQLLEFISSLEKGEFETPQKIIDSFNRAEGKELAQKFSKYITTAFEPGISTESIDESGKNDEVFTADRVINDLILNLLSYDKDNENNSRSTSWGESASSQNTELENRGCELQQDFSSQQADEALGSLGGIEVDATFSLGELE
jgi:hypothetical protein